MGRRVPFQNNEYYHVYNRGVEKRVIFMDVHDYRRFRYILEEFNTTEPVYNVSEYVEHQKAYTRGRTSGKKLVMIENYCLMPNHYHLCLRQLIPGGISKYLQKVMTGYTMYFNLRHDRSGALFQGKTKSKHVDEERYLNYLHYYIDLNPLTILYPEWKTRGVPSGSKARMFLEKFPWNKRTKYGSVNFNVEKIKLYENSLQHSRKVKT